MGIGIQSPYLFGSVQELGQRKIFFLFFAGGGVDTIHLCGVEPIARALPGAVLLRSPPPDVFQALAFRYVGSLD